MPAPAVVGGPVADMPVAIVEYDASWPHRYQEEVQHLHPALSQWLEGGVHHVGSTAVESLAAKPVIDIMAGVTDLEDARAAIPVLETLGYMYWEWDPHPWRLWFLKPEPRHRTHHLHLVEPDHPEFRAKLAFRDRLRHDTGLREDYEQLKRELAAEHPNDRDAYTEAKSDFIVRVLKEEGLAEGVPPRNYTEARKAAGIRAGELPPGAQRALNGNDGR